MDDVRFAEMISKIAHEMRSPLTSVKGFSATLLSRWERFSDEQRYELVQSIHHDAERMGRIVAEVLDLARSEAGRLELHKEQVDVAELIEAARSHVAAYPGAERITAEIEENLSVTADSDRLLHVVGNLIENAVKFSDDGPISIRASRQASDVVIEVEDAGVGIAPERLAEIFSGPAPRGGKATPSGTGLGLYLSKRLMDAHGGRLTVTSNLNAGSVFRAELPGTG